MYFIVIFFIRSEGRAYSLNATEVAPGSARAEDYIKDRSPLAIGSIMIILLKCLMLLLLIFIYFAASCNDHKIVDNACVTHDKNSVWLFTIL